jgi:hypothetical protein
LKVQDLVGSKVWFKRAYGPEHQGYISSIPMPVDVENIEDAITASTFRVDLPSGDVVQISGRWLTRIDSGS